MNLFFMNLFFYEFIKSSITVIYFYVEFIGKTSYEDYYNYVMWYILMPYLEKQFLVQDENSERNLRF